MLCRNSRPGPRIVYVHAIRMILDFERHELYPYPVVGGRPDDPLTVKVVGVRLGMSRGGELALVLSEKTSTARDTLIKVKGIREIRAYKDDKIRIPGTAAQVIWNPVSFLLLSE